MRGSQRIKIKKHLILQAQSFYLSVSLLEYTTESKFMTKNEISVDAMKFRMNIFEIRIVCKEKRKNVHDIGYKDKELGEYVLMQYDYIEYTGRIILVGSLGFYKTFNIDVSLSLSKKFFCVFELIEVVTSHIYCILFLTQNDVLREISRKFMSINSSLL